MFDIPQAGRELLGDSQCKMMGKVVAGGLLESLWREVLGCSLWRELLGCSDAPCGVSCLDAFLVWVRATCSHDTRRWPCELLAFWQLGWCICASVLSQQLTICHVYDEKHGGTFHAIVC